MKVWIIESGEYENRSVDHVVSSPEDAPAVIDRFIAKVHSESTSPHLPEYHVGELKHGAYGPIVEVAYTPKRGRGWISIYSLTEYEVETSGPHVHVWDSSGRNGEGFGRCGACGTYRDGAL